MATSKSHLEASASSSSSTSARCTYHVFLSFRGEDTRKNFTDHLYTALVQAGFHTFRDDDEIQRGENIGLEIQKAIRESKISIIVFSKDYASSRWCLDELAMIMERKKLFGQHVVPIFYDVDPTHVRKQTGSYGEAFARHKERFKGEMRKVEGWSEALREVADLGGMVLQDGYEAQFILNIIKEVRKKFNPSVLHVPSYLVGVHSRVVPINLWLQTKLDDVGIATIYGIGGIGKTTIAKTIYNLNFDKFDGSSFLANVREVSEQANGLVQLQRKLLSDLLKGDVKEIFDADEGIIKIKHAISWKKVLLILDDVDQLEQFNAIIGMREWFCPGSKVIITTRHELLLRAHEVDAMFEVKTLNGNESLHLFSWHAFGQDHPMDGYEKHCDNVVHHCSGLPLALQVLGSSLSGKFESIWESTLQKLKLIANDKVQKILKISYDSLPDDHDRSLFLDMACFFTGMDKDDTVKILDGCNFYTIVGIQNLRDRCLLTISEENKLVMHQLLRDMGREIVRQESPDDPGKCSRLWDHKDALTVLRENTGSGSIRGLRLQLSTVVDDNRTSKTSSATAKRCHDEDSNEKWMMSDRGNCSKRQRLSFLSWLPVNTTLINTFSTNALAKMCNIKFLLFKNIKLDGSYKNFPRSLVWLRWHGCPLKFLPNEIFLEKLVVLEMRNSNLIEVWKGNKSLMQLETLDLSYSHGLVRTPNFIGLPSLEKLILKDCIKLDEVDESIGHLTSLAILNLENCKCLKNLPANISKLTSLEELRVSGCVNLELPEDLGNLVSLRVLHANRTATSPVESSTKVLKKLGLSNWLSTLWPWRLPIRSEQSLSLPRSLVELNLAGCRISDKAFPKDLSCLPFLQKLDLSGNPICCLPESIKSLTMLRDLNLVDCARLQSLPELPPRLGNLLARNCVSMESMRNVPMCIMSWVMLGCKNLVEIQDLFKLEPIENVDTHVLNNLGLFDVGSLRSIQVEMHNALSYTRRKTTIQVLHEGGMFSTFLPGNEVPDWFRHRNRGSSLSLDVPSVTRDKVHGFSFCIVYASQDVESSVDDEYCFEINIKTMGLDWTYTPAFYGIPNASGDMLWLIHWMFGVSDQVHVSVKVPFNFLVKECGIHLTVEQEEIGTKFHSKELIPRISTVPWYRNQLIGYLARSYEQRDNQGAELPGPVVQEVNETVEEVAEIRCCPGKEKGKVRERIDEAGREKLEKHLHELLNDFLLDLRRAHGESVSGSLRKDDAEI